MSCLASICFALTCCYPVQALGGGGVCVPSPLLFVGALISALLQQCLSQFQRCAFVISLCTSPICIFVALAEQADCALWLLPHHHRRTRLPVQSFEQPDACAPGPGCAHDQRQWIQRFRCCQWYVLEAPIDGVCAGLKLFEPD